MLNKRNLEVVKFAPVKESRYTYNNILVGPEGTVATDGHMLAIVSLPENDPAAFPVKDGLNFKAGKGWKPFMLAANTVKGLMKAIPKVKGAFQEKLGVIAIDPEQTDGNGNAVMAVTDLNSSTVLNPPKVDGQFPNYDTVMPKPEDATATISFNAEFMAELCKLAAQFEGRNHTVTLRLYGPDRVMRLDAKDPHTGQTFVGLLMSLRPKS